VFANVVVIVRVFNARTIAIVLAGPIGIRISSTYVAQVERFAIATAVSCRVRQGTPRGSWRARISVRVLVQFGGGSGGTMPAIVQGFSWFAALIQPKRIPVGCNDFVIADAIVIQVPQTRSSARSEHIIVQHCPVALARAFGIKLTRLVALVIQFTLEASIGEFAQAIEHVGQWIVVAGQFVNAPFDNV
jgi:hypothetical protein